MHFVDSRPGVIRSINQRWLLNYWLRIRCDHTLPAWPGLGAEELARLTESLTYSDVVEDPAGVRFLIRFHGEKIAETFGSNCKGKFLDEILPLAIREPALETYRRLLVAKRPVYTVVNVLDRLGRPVHYERLLLPFGGDHANVDRVLASLETVSPDGAFENRDLMKLPNLNAEIAICAVINQT